MKNRKANATNDDISLKEALTDLSFTDEQAEQAKGGILRGSAGNDYLVGGDGRDVLLGGGGLDVLIGNTGGDR